MIRGLPDVSSRNQSSQAKDMVVCQELLKSIEDFKKFLIEQKKIREDLVNTSFGLLQTLKTDLESVNNQVSIAVTNLRKISTSAARLKADVLKEEQHASLANKGSEHAITDNANLSSYFLKKLGQFETRMRLYKEELEAFEENVYSKSYTSLTSRDLLNVLTKMDHDFVDVAAQLYTVLESVKTLKAQYLKKYKAIHGPNRNPFGDSDELAIKAHSFDEHFRPNSLGSLKKGIASNAPYGPSPFGSTMDNSSANLIGLSSPDKQLSNKLTGVTSTIGAAPNTTTVPSLFGATASTAPSLFGTTTTTTAPTLFGATATSTAATSTGFSFLRPTATTLGTTTSAGILTGFSLPTAATTAATGATGFAFGSLGAAATTTTQASTATPTLQPTGFPAPATTTGTSLFKPTFGF